MLSWLSLLNRKQLGGHYRYSVFSKSLNLLWLSSCPSYHFESCKNMNKRYLTGRRTSQLPKMVSIIFLFGHNFFQLYESNKSVDRLSICLQIYITLYHIYCLIYVHIYACISGNFWLFGHNEHYDQSKMAKLIAKNIGK